jgi:hypothetical protein
LEHYGSRWSHQWGAMNDKAQGLHLTASSSGFGSWRAQRCVCLCPYSAPVNHASERPIFTKQKLSKIKRSQQLSSTSNLLPHTTLGATR